MSTRSMLAQTEHNLRISVVKCKKEMRLKHLAWLVSLLKEKGIYVTLAAHFNVQTCLKHVKELFSRTGNKKRPGTTNSLKNKRQI